MKLFLSSHRCGGHDEVLLSLLGQVRDIAVITNAKDYKTAAERTESVAALLADLTAIGLCPVEVDLRPYFRMPGAGDKLAHYKAIMLAGGNTFVLRRALAYAQCDDWLTQQVVQDRLIYVGESAGAVMATPSLIGVEYGDEPGLIPEGYRDDSMTQGLGLVDYCIVPHHASTWAGSVDMIRALQTAGLSYKTLRNDQALIINGASEYVV